MISHSTIFLPLDIFLFLLLKDNCNIFNLPLQEWREKNVLTHSAAGRNGRDQCRRQIRQFVKGKEASQPAFYPIMKISGDADGDWTPLFRRTRKPFYLSPEEPHQGSECANDRWLGRTKN